jgi:HlyD family secretion protein
MKQIFKKKSFWIVTVIVIVIIGIVIASSGGGEKTEYTTEDAKIGTLTQTVTATGAIDSSQDIDLSFRAGGRVVFLNVNEGDEVKAGQVLASINSASLSAQVSQYRANLAVAQADLDKIKAGSSQEQVEVTMEKLIKAENDLASLKSKRNNELQTLREKSTNSLNNASFTMVVALDKVYNHLVASDKTIYLQVSDSFLKNSVTSEYYIIKDKIAEAQEMIDLANANKTSSNIITVSTNIVSTMNDLSSFLDSSFLLADKIVINTNYPQTTKDAIKSDISTQQSTNNTTLVTLQTAKSNLISSIDSYISQIQAAESALSIAQAELKLTQADPREFELNSARAKVGQAQAQLNKVLADLADYAIIAPIDGVVTKVNYNLGEQAVASQTVIKMLSTEEYEINVDIPESDIAKLKVGDEVVIELDAFGSDHLFAGKVAFIDPAQTVIQDVTYYSTTVSLESNSWVERIKPGMSADVTITTAEKNDVIYIPQRAVKIREALLGEVPEKYVEVLINEEEVEEKTVEVGLRGDGGLVEILSGIEDGDRVITFKKNNK